MVTVDAFYNVGLPRIIATFDIGMKAVAALHLFVYFGTCLARCSKMVPTDTGSAFTATLGSMFANPKRGTPACAQLPLYFDSDTATHIELTVWTLITW